MESKCWRELCHTSELGLGQVPVWAVWQCAKLNSVAGESPRLFLKNYFRGEDLGDTF